MPNHKRHKSLHFININLVCKHKNKTRSTKCHILQKMLLNPQEREDVKFYIIGHIHKCKATNVRDPSVQIKTFCQPTAN